MINLKTWRNWLLTGATFTPPLIYVFVLTMSFHKEALGEVEGTPLAAMYFTNGALTTTTSNAQIATAAIEFKPDMMGDEQIKVLREPGAKLFYDRAPSPGQLIFPPRVR